MTSNKLHENIYKLNDEYLMVYINKCIMDLVGPKFNLNLTKHDFQKESNMSIKDCIYYVSNNRPLSISLHEIYNMNNILIIAITHTEYFEVTINNKPYYISFELIFQQRKDEEFYFDCYNVKTDVNIKYSDDDTETVIDNKVSVYWNDSYKCFCYYTYKDIRGSSPSHLKVKTNLNDKTVLECNKRSFKECSHYLSENMNAKSSYPTTSKEVFSWVVSNNIDIDPLTNIMLDSNDEMHYLLRFS